jgi:DNA-binding transcriptional LysR family regulator
MRAPGKSFPLIFRGLVIDQINGAWYSIDMLNVHHLELFYYVARAGGVTAALRLVPYGIQQPAVSSQIRELEKAIGRPLFERRPFALTAAGRVVFEQIAPFFSALPGLARGLQGDNLRHLRLVANASVLREHLPGILKTMRSRTPGLRLTLRDGGQETAERMLLEHEADVAMTLFNRKPVARLRHEVLLKLPMVLLLPRSVKATSPLQIIREAIAGGTPLIAIPAREPLSALFHRELARRGLEWPGRIEASDTALVETYVAHGFGIGLSVDPPGAPRPKAIRAVTLRGFPQLIFGALWCAESSELVKAFLDLARRRATELGSAL